MAESKTIRVYTDGSCVPNPGNGGWGFVSLGAIQLIQYGGALTSTNNRMEFTAVLKFLQAISHEGKKYQVTIVSDSKYVVNSMSKWVREWKRHNWRVGINKGIKNLDLIKQIYQLTQEHDVTFKWVKAHSGNRYNELADSLANQGAKYNKERAVREKGRVEYEKTKVARALGLYRGS